LNRRRWLVNYLLIAAAISLGFLAKNNKTEEPPTPPTTGVISNLQPDQVMWLRLLEQNRPAVVLERNGSGWQLREPVALPADNKRVERLLALATAPTYLRISTPEAQLAEYGLNNPRYRVVFNNTEFQFGATNPLNQRRYMGIGEETVQTDDRYLYQITGGWPALASRRLLPAADAIIELVLPTQVITLQNGNWQSSGAPAADPERAATTAALWLASEAERLAPTSNWHGAPVTIRYHDDDGEQLAEFLVQRSKHGFWLHRLTPAVSYHLPLALGHQLLYPALPLAPE